ISAMFALIFEWGSVTSSWYAELALRRRVKKSAIGSVIVMTAVSPSSRRFPYRGLPRTFSTWSVWSALRASAHREGLRRHLPAGLLNAWELAGVRHLAQADAAQPELAVDRVRAAALVAAGVAAHLELRLLVGLVDQSLLCHLLSSP